jgi:hypothetical protein
LHNTCCHTSIPKTITGRNRTTLDERKGRFQDAVVPGLHADIVQRGNDIC